MLSRRTVLSAALLGSASFASLGVHAAPPANGYKTITWDSLVPKDWNPNDLLKQQPPADLQDNDPRAQAMLAKMREAWDNAPTNTAVNNTKVRLPGYLVPLEQAESGQVSEFLLVPYFGACIHTPPPPANQIVHVLPQKPAKFKAMDAVWVSGTLQVSRNASSMGTSGYRLEAVTVERYKPD